jgi:6-phosphogluconolactonase
MMILTKTKRRRNVRYFKDYEEFSQYAAGFINNLIVREIRGKGICHLCLAGGRTPVRMYELLSLYHHIEWDKVHAFLGDERYVSFDSLHSNFNMINRTLLSKVRIPPNNIHRINTDIRPIQAAAQNYEKQLRRYLSENKRNLFDILLLGMGSDGHIASLFPGDPELDSKKGAWVRYIRPPNSHLSLDRITITLELINKAKNIVFLLTEEGKEKIVNYLVKDNEKVFLKYPAGRVRPVYGNVYWFVSKTSE